MLRKLLVSALLVVMPFSGMRVICLDPSAEASTAADQDEQSSDCDRICALHRPIDSGTGSNCALTADPSSLVIIAGSAVLPWKQPMQLPTVVLLQHDDISQLYLEPGLARLNPPPKA
jgi:hypothetical protein